MKTTEKLKADYKNAQQAYLMVETEDNGLQKVYVGDEIRTSVTYGELDFGCEYFKVAAIKSGYVVVEFATGNFDCKRDIQVEVDVDQILGVRRAA